MASRSKRRRFIANGPSVGADDPLGIGVSKKALIWIGVAGVAFLAYRAWKAKQKRGGVAGTNELAPTAPEATPHNAMSNSAPQTPPRDRMERNGMERSVPEGRI